MRPRFNYTTKADVIRLSDIGNKSVYGATGSSFKGFFQPIDADANTIALGIMGQAFVFHTSGDADIKPSDRLTINSVDYRVRGTRSHLMKRQGLLICVLELPVEN